jgi:hypothetical protein
MPVKAFVPLFVVLPVFLLGFDLRDLRAHVGGFRDRHKNTQGERQQQKVENLFHRLQRLQKLILGQSLNVNQAFSNSLALDGTSSSLV